MEFEYTRCTIFQESDCDTDPYLVAANVREIVVVSKQASQEFDVEIFNLTKVNDLEVRKRYQIQISKRFADLETLNEERT